METRKITPLLTCSLHLLTYILSYNWMACVLQPCIEVLNLFSSEKTSAECEFRDRDETMTSQLWGFVEVKMYAYIWIGECERCANTVQCDSHLLLNSTNSAVWEKKIQVCYSLLLTNRPCSLTRCISMKIQGILVWQRVTPCVTSTWCGSTCGHHHQSTF